ncbi:MAG: hypothetical protein AAF432_06955 [Planctomycetota bacterium]
MNDALLQSAGVWLAWFGFAALVFALFFNRVRRLWTKHRRCPKCWYDMSRTQGLTCSECGKTVKRERSLRKAKPRRRLALIALLILLLGYAGQVTPGVKARGWVAAIPTPVLLCAVPFIEPFGPLVKNSWIDGESNRQPWPTSTRSDSIALELFRRAKSESTLAGHLRSWSFWTARAIVGRQDSALGTPFEYRSHGAWLVDRISWSGDREPWWFDGRLLEPPDVASLHEFPIQLRQSLAAGDTIYAPIPTRHGRHYDREMRIEIVQVDAARESFNWYFAPWWHSGQSDMWYDAIAPIGEVSSDDGIVNFDVTYRVCDHDFYLYDVTREYEVKRERRQIPIAVAEDPHDVMAPLHEGLLAMCFVDSRPVARIEQTGMSVRLFPHLERLPDHQRIRTGDAWLERAWKRRHQQAYYAVRNLPFVWNAVVACELEAHVDGAPVAAGFIWFDKETTPRSSTSPLRKVKLKPIDDDQFRNALANGGEWALVIRGSRNVALRHPTARYYVSGEITLPVEIVP